MTAYTRLVETLVALMGFYSDEELAERRHALEVASTIPAPPPDGCDPAPASAPAVDLDSELGAEFGERCPPSCPETWR